MSKVTFLLLLLVVLGTSLKLHLEEQVQDDSPEAQAAQQRLMTFITSDKALMENLLSGKEPTEQQTQKLMEFMMNDEYYQKDLIKTLQEDPQTAWISQLTPAAKGRFFKLMTSYSQKQLQDQNVQEQIAKKLLTDPQIGPYMIKKFGGAKHLSVSAALKSSHLYISKALDV